MTQAITRNRNEKMFNDIKVEAEKLYFDAYQISELYTIFDGYKEEERMYDKWLLWAFIQKCFPKYTLADYTWDLNFSNPLTPFIWIRRKDDIDK